MCYMIAVGLPPSAHQRWIERLPQPLRAWPAAYQGLAAQMNHFDVSIVGTAMCSCDLFNRSTDAKVREKYLKKGWSSAKIERAMADRKMANVHTGLHPDLRQWLADAATDAHEAYLFIHWDSDEPNYDRRISVSPDDLRKQTVPIKDEQLIYVNGKAR